MRKAERRSMTSDRGDLTVGENVVLICLTKSGNVLICDTDGDVKTERVFGSDVEKLCESVWGNVWEMCGKVSTWLRFGRVFRRFWGKVRVIRKKGGKFYQRIYTVVLPCKIRVLHIFHRPYYYNY